MGYFFTAAKYYIDQMFGGRWQSTHDFTYKQLKRAARESSPSTVEDRFERLLPHSLAEASECDALLAKQVDKILAAKDRLHGSPASARQAATVHAMAKFMREHTQQCSTPLESHTIAEHIPLEVEGTIRAALRLAEETCMIMQDPVSPKRAFQLPCCRRFIDREALLEWLNRDVRHGCPQCPQQSRVLRQCMRDEGRAVLPYSAVVVFRSEIERTRCLLELEAAQLSHYKDAQRNNIVLPSYSNEAIAAIFDANPRFSSQEAATHIIENELQRLQCPELQRHYRIESQELILRLKSEGVKKIYRPKARMIMRRLARGITTEEAYLFYLSRAQKKREAVIAAREAKSGTVAASHSTAVAGDAKESTCPEEGVIDLPVSTLHEDTLGSPHEGQPLA